MISNKEKKQKDPSQKEINFILKLLYSNKIKEAKKEIEAQIRKNPESSVSYNILGAVFASQNLHIEAIDNYKKALNLNSSYAEAYNNLGIVYQKLDMITEAIQHYKKAISLKNDFAEAYNNLGNVLGETKESLSYFEKAIKIKPNYPEAFNNIANTYLNFGDKKLALENFKKSIKLNPNYAEVYNRLGLLYEEMSEFEKSLSNYKKAIKLKPEYEIAHNNLGNLLNHLGNYNEATLAYRQALKVKPDYAVAYSNLLFNLNYLIKFEPNYYLSIAKEFRKNCKLKKINFEYCFEKKPEKLKVGFVSADFGNHPGGYFTLDTLKELKKGNFELIAYSCFDRKDDISKDFRNLFSKWRSIEKKKDEDIVKEIVSDGIHILIDLQGHSAKNRLPIFFYKAAPIQVSWLSQGTLGIKEIDYLVGSPYITPEKEENHFIEKIWRLPEITQSFTRPNFDAPINNLPFSKNNFITFGSLNKISKVNDGVIMLWSKVLKAVPNSKLLIRNKDLDNQQIKENLYNKFNNQKVNKERLIFLGETKTRRELLETYNKIDIALDPFPFQGNTSTCEATWMGVPVLTLKGDRFLFHFGESINSNLDMREWIAENNEEYVSKAVKFSSDFDQLSKIRKNLRKNAINSPVFDSLRFSNFFGNMLWEMWKKNKT